MGDLERGPIFCQNFDFACNCRHGKQIWLTEFAMSNTNKPEEVNILWLVNEDDSKYDNFTDDDDYLRHAKTISK